MAYTGLKNRFAKRPIRIIYTLYWVLLAYILAALSFWFTALNKQNVELSHYKLDMIDVDQGDHTEKVNRIKSETDRKTAQYLGEGIAFLLLIGAGAGFVFNIINRQLIQSQQQQNFMMAITHELKTPIAVTKLNLETMQRRKLDADQQQKLIRTTIQEANRLNALCNNILLLSQIDAGGYTITNERFDFGTLANDCVDEFLMRFPARTIQTYFDGDVRITGDRLLLQLAVNNLLDNAIKYSGHDDVILLKVFKEGKFVKLQVIDEGKGIASEEQGRIFEKYFRGAQRQTKGTGLGLYLTKEIVKQHHGDISMTNNIPHGCIFEMKLKSPKNHHH